MSAPPRLQFLLPLALAAALCACGSEDARPRGVILISVDSLRADHLSCYGYTSRTAPGIVISPVIDTLLAEQGTLFETAVSSTSWTLPAHMALLTGKPDALHGVQDQADRLHPSHTLLAESFLRAGWRTGGFWSGPNLHPEFGFERGFEEYIDCSGVDVDDPGVLLSTTDEEFEQVLDIHNRSHTGITGPTVVAAFEEWLDGVGEDEPFFAFVHLWDVHYDYEPPERYDVFYPDYEGPVKSGALDELANLRPIRPQDVQRLVSLYDGEIRFTDDNIGRMLGALRERGRLDDTLVVLTSDHGEEFFEHKRFGHKWALYEESVRIPLLLRWPGIVPARRRVDELVGIVDIAPTVLDLCGLARPEGMWGRSLRPALVGELEPRAIPMELVSRRQRLNQRAWHDGASKVLQESDRSEPKLYTLERDFLELGRDSGELSGKGRRASRLPGNEEIAAALALWEDLADEASRLEHIKDGELSDELTQRLIDTGYLDGGDPDDEPQPPDEDDGDAPR